MIKYLTSASKLATYLRISDSTISRHMRGSDWRDIPHVRVGKRRDMYFNIEEVMAYLQKKFN